MPRGSIPPSTSALLEVVLSSTDHALCDRLLLETCIQASGAQAGILLRAEPDRPWHAIVGRGPRDLLPEVAAIATELSNSAIHSVRCGVRVVRAQACGRALAVVFGGLPPEESDELWDEIDALLGAVLVIEAALRGSSGEPVAPLPSGSDEERRLQHDLRNALSGLRTTRDVLERYGTELGDGEARAFHDAVERECGRAGALLAHGILGSHGTVKSRSCQPAEVVRDVVDTEVAFARSDGVRLALTVFPEVPRTAGIGALELARLMRNALVNAREALALRSSSSEGHVGVTLQGLPQAPGWTALTIEDDGPGLPEAEIAHLLRPGISHGKSGGTGLGLAAIQECARSAGCALLLERRASGGARLEIWLPPDIAVARPGAAPGKS